MRAIVTGGAGFIGSHLSESLKKRGVSVSIWDNLFRGRRENIAHILDDENRFVLLDIANEENIKIMADLIFAERPAYIFHYAAINGTQYFYDIPAKVLEVNTMATYNLMRALREVKKNSPKYSCKIVFASSSEVYGEPLSLPSKESDITYVNIENKRDSYAASKLAGEFFVKLISEELGHEYLALRLFNVYGPRMIGTKYGQVIPEFIQRLAGGEYPIRVYGDGSHMRSFCYIDDNIEMTINLALSDAPRGVYNIGLDEETSIRDLGRMIMEKMGRKAEFIFLPEREGDHLRRRSDMSKYYNVMPAYTPIPLKEGLTKLIHGLSTQ